MKHRAFTKIIILLVIVGIVCCALWLSFSRPIRAKEIRSRIELYLNEQPYYEATAAHDRDK